jgi:nicotinate-nucleotide--dimethylbenzimidazole phosphoribosyltransferase
MAADHGVTVEGVSAYPQEVTVQMVGNFLRGGAAINVLARLFGLGLRIVDIGVAGEHGCPPAGASDDIRYDLPRIRRGTGNMVTEPAMSTEEASRAVGVGLEVASDEFSRGTQCICLGEMGIGNTTAASAILSAFTGENPTSLVGPGTGVDSQGLGRKAEAIRKAISRHGLTPGSDPMQVLSAVGGLEIAGLVGIILGAAGARRPVVLDGFITGAAALVAARLEPRTVGYMIPSHRSSEPAHAAMLELMDLRPLLDLDLRLGEGTGAALAFHLLEAAVAVISQMATFDGAGVSKKLDGDRRARQ